MELQMIALAALVVVEAGLAAIVILIAKKYRLDLWYDVRRRSWMPERCELCLSFWVCLIIFATMVFVNVAPQEAFYCLSPFCAAPFSRLVWSN